MTELSFQLKQGEQHVPHSIFLPPPPPPPSKCWLLLHGEMRCAIKANLRLYCAWTRLCLTSRGSSGLPAGERESREASIGTRRGGLRSTGAVNSIWKSERGGPLFDSWHLKVRFWNRCEHAIGPVRGGQRGIQFDLEFACPWKKKSTSGIFFSNPLL